MRADPFADRPLGEVAGAPNRYPEAAAPRFEPSTPLGGLPPAAEAAEHHSEVRDLLLIGGLLVLSVVAGAASLLPWRDFGRRLGAPIEETGWVTHDGALGRGWVAVVLGVLVAVAGVLIAAERGRFGRSLAVITGLSLAGLAIGEWGFGNGGMRLGPGLGLWVLLVVGVLVVILVGVLAPPLEGTEERSPGPGANGGMPSSA